MPINQTKITMNLQGLEDMAAEIGGRFHARVGVLGAKATRPSGNGTLNNAELGTVHQFGRLDGSIPARDFLKMPLEDNRQELVKSMGSAPARAAFKAKDYKKLFAILGVKAEEFVQQAFDTGGFGKWKPLKPATVKRKGSAAILINTAELRKAITSDVEGQ